MQSRSWASGISGGRSKKTSASLCCTPAGSRCCWGIACGRSAAPSPDSASHVLQGPMELEQQALGGLPVDARIRDGQAVFELAQVLRNGLIPRLQVTLEHEPDNGAVAGSALRDGGFRHQGLQSGFLVEI